MNKNPFEETPRHPARMVRRLDRNLSLQLPPALAERLGLTPGSEVHLAIAGGTIVITPAQGH